MWNPLPPWFQKLFGILIGMVVILFTTYLLISFGRIEYQSILFIIGGLLVLYIYIYMMPIGKVEKDTLYLRFLFVWVPIKNYTFKGVVEGALTRGMLIILDDYSFLRKTVYLPYRNAEDKRILDFMLSKSKQTVIT